MTQEQEKLVNHILEQQRFLEAMNMPVDLFDDLFKIHYSKKQ